ncbi:unnamed protein product, partial [Mesorhabditis spiculigera]
MGRRSARSISERLEGEPEVGETYTVTRVERGQAQNSIATVIATKVVSAAELRSHRLEKEKLGTNAAGDEQVNEEESQTLYYIHFENMDRRLDEWVERSRFQGYGSVDLAAPVSENRPSKMTRSQRRIDEEFNHLSSGIQHLGATSAKLEKEFEERTKVRNVESIVLGKWEINPWYWSPYPAPFDTASRLFICEFCLSYFKDLNDYAKHTKFACTSKTPPGKEIYKKGNLRLYEVFGSAQKLYAQSLCLMSKLFLDHKTLYYDVGTFIFYVLCEADADGSHIVGNFSKETNTGNNLACIMVLPPYQRKGYGKLLIQISYELSSREGWIGTPEKPLSDLGKVSYRSYWWWVLLETLERLDSPQTIRMSIVEDEAGIHTDDIFATLHPVNMTKSWKGEQVVKAGVRVLEHCRSLGLCRPPSLLLDRKCLHWTPSQIRGPPRKSHKRLV